MVQKGFVQLLLSPGLLLILSGLIAALLGLTIQDYRDSSKSDGLFDATSQAASFNAALTDEFVLRYLTVDATVATSAAKRSAQVSTDQALSKFITAWSSHNLDSLTASQTGFSQEDFSTAYAQWYSNPTPLTYQNVVTKLVSMLFLASSSTIPARWKSIMSFVQGHFAVQAVDLDALTHYALLNKVGVFTSSPYLVSMAKAAAVDDSLAFLLSPATSAVHQQVQSLISQKASTLVNLASPTALTLSESSTINAVKELQTLSAALDADLKKVLSTTKNSAYLLQEVIALSVGLGVSLLITFLSAFVLHRNNRFTDKWATLSQEFDDQKATNILQNTYKPLIKDMTTTTKPPKPSTELEVPFYQAARLIQQLRPHLPQTLFGEYNTSGGSGNKSHAGQWSIDGEAARLETGSAVIQCTVMLLYASPPPQTIPSTDAAGIQEFYDHALTVVTTEVNRRGGVIHAVSIDFHVTAVWNACHPVENAPLRALEAAEAVCSTILAGTHLDINVCTGSCLMSSTKAGDNKYVTFFGAPFDLGEKIMALNRLHDVVIAVDSKTYEALPRTQQLNCKPIAVFHESGDSSVIMSYDDEEPMKGERWKAYNTAFTMYRSGYLEESIEAFEQYLVSYPNDRCAKWLLQYVLLPYKRERRANSSAPGRP